MKVYQCINKVQAELAKVGISKDQRNAQQGFNFRGIDAVYNALSPLLAKHGLCILPRVTDRTVTERTTAKGGVLFYAVVNMAFDFVASEDGSLHIVNTVGEAMDSGDKATNKAMSAAYKYACMQAFCIPTEGESPDADAETHDHVEPKKESAVHAELMRLIHTKNLIAKVKPWCEHFKVAGLNELSDYDLQKLIDKIMESK